MTASRSLRASSRRFAAGGLLSLLCALPQSSAEASTTKTGVVAGSGTTLGGVLTAGLDGAEYVLPSQARLSLAPGAAVRVFPKSQQLQLAPGKKTTTYSFALVHGRVDVRVPSKMARAQDRREARYRAY